MTTRRNVDEARHLIMTEGINVAVAALIEVCRDGTAPAPARATAATSLIRAAGLFEKAADDDKKDLSEMTGEELRRRIDQLQAQAPPYQILPSEDDEDGDPLG